VHSFFAYFADEPTPPPSFTSAPTAPVLAAAGLGCDTGCTVPQMMDCCDLDCVKGRVVCTDGDRTAAFCCEVTPASVPPPDLTGVELPTGAAGLATLGEADWMTWSA